MRTNIISVKYEDNYIPKTFSGKEYCYYTTIPVELYDLVIAPTQNEDKIALVTEINISENQIKNIKPYLKSVTSKIDQEKFLQENVIQILKEAA